MNENHFDQLCRVFELYTYDYKDIQELVKQVLDLIAKHEDRLKEAGIHVDGVKKYAEGWLEHKLIREGFFYVAGSLEMAALVDIKQFKKVINNTKDEIN